MTIELTAQVRSNEIEEPFDGGRLLLHCDDAEAKKLGFHQIEVICNALTDEALAQFPSTRADKEARKFRVTVTEIAE